MKLLFIVITLLSMPAFSAELNLRSGEQADISANSPTHVTCEGGQRQDCKQIAESFRSTLEYCAQTYTPGSCALKYWPSFKQNNPTCTSAGVSVCLEYCSQTYTPGSCADRCQ